MSAADSSQWFSSLDLWRLSDGAHIRTIDTGASSEFSYSNVFFSPDGSTVAAQPYNGLLNLYRVSDGTRTAQLPYNNCVLSPDGQTITDAGDFFSVSTGAKISSWSSNVWGNYQNEAALAWSSNGVLAVTAYDPSTSTWYTQLRNITDGSLLQNLPAQANLEPASAAFSPDGSTLYVNGSVYLGDPTGQGEFYEYTQVWNGNTLARVVQTSSFTGNDEANFAISSSRQTVLYCGILTNGNYGTGFIYQFSLLDGSQLASWSYDGPGCRVGGVTYSPDEQIIASASDDGYINLYHAADGAPIRTIDYGSYLGSLAFSPDGTKIVASSGAQSFGGDGTTKVFDVSTGDLLYQIGTPSSNPDGSGAQTYAYSAISPNGAYLAIAFNNWSNNESLTIYRLSDGTLLRTLSTQGGTALAFSPDSKTIACVGGIYYPLGRWNVATGASLNGISYTSNVPYTGYGLAYSPDGKTLALAEGDQIYLYRISDMTLLHTLTGHTDQVYSVAFAPDGQTLMSGSNDSTLRFWRVSDGSLLHTYDQETSMTYGGASGVFSAIYSCDGTQIVYGRGDATLVVAQNPYYKPPVPAAVSISPATIVGSLPGSGTVTLNEPAPLGGLTVSLKCLNPAAMVPSSIFVPGCSKSASFTIHTSAVTTLTTGSLQATVNGVTKSATLKVRPIGVKSVKLSATSVKGGSSLTGTVTLEADAAPGAITVSFASSNTAVVPNPASITIPVGSLTGSFTINTNAVTASTPVTIQVTANGITKTAKLTVNP